MERKSLSDILHGSERDTIASAWQTTEAAEDFAPLPAGEYNRLKSFTVVGIDKPERDAFAPTDEPADEATENAKGDNTGDESQDDPAGDGDSAAACEAGAGT